MFDTHIPPPASPTPANRSLFNEVRALKLDVSQVVPIHGKPAPWSEFLKVVGSKSQ